MNNQIVNVSANSPQLFTALDTDLFSTFVPLQNTNLKYTWKAAKIPFSVWKEIIAFHLWSEKTNSGNETQGDLYYNKETKEWRNVIFPQIGQGLSTKVDESKQDVIDALAMEFNYPWIKAGTHHNHCRIGASQSGVDKADEDAKPGIHFTFGKLNLETFDIHLRAVVQRYHYNCTDYWTEFVDLSDEFFSDPDVVSALEKLNLNKLTITLDGKQVPVFKTWEKTNNSDKLKLLSAIGVDLGCVYATPLLSIKPDLEQYKEQIKVWEKMVEKPKAIVKAHTPTYGGFTQHDYEWGDYGNRFSENRFRGSPIKANQKTVPFHNQNATKVTKPNKVYTLPMFLEHFDKDNSDVIKNLWSVFEEEDFNFEKLIFLCNTPSSLISGKNKPLMAKMMTVFQQSELDSMNDFIALIELVQGIAEGQLV